MEKFTTRLMSEMTKELQKIAVESDNFLQQAQRSFFCADEVLKKIKNFILEYTFQNAEDEIKFFKNIKPSFLKKLLYSKELFDIQANKPVGTLKAQKNYYLQVLQRIELFFEKNRYFYNYYKTGESYFDDIYFVRNSEQLPLVPVYYLDMDASFSTPYSFMLSKMMALEEMKDFLYQAIQENLVPQADENNKKQSTWTDSKSALIELAYALHSRGSVNFGKGDIKQLISDLEFFFNIRLGNVYRVYMDMLIRKKSRTPFLDNLTSSLIKRMDEADE